MTTNTITTIEALDAMVADYMALPEWVLDVETRGKERLNPRQNEIFWIGFASYGRVDIIPLGHDLGALVKPQEKIQAPHAECPDRKRCVTCPDRIVPLTKKGEPTRRKVTHLLEAKYAPPPKQLDPAIVWERLRPLLFGDARKIGHNVKFDIESIAKHYDGVWPPGPYGDTSVLAALVNENHGEGQYKLGPCIKREFDFTYEKIGKYVDVVSFEEARFYNSMDVRWTWLLWRKLRRMLAKEKLEQVFDLEMDVLKVVIDMEMAGCPIDVEGFRALHDELDHRLRQIEKKIEEANGGPINLNADLQVAALVYDKRGHKCAVFTEKTQQRSTARAALEPFKKDPIVALLLEWAEIHKVFSTYIENNIANVERDGKIFGEFDQMGARTGRFSSRNPNLQNIPVRRGKQVRELFIAGPGMKLVVADYSQVELRILAHFTEDKNLMAAYNEGLDLHSLTARKAYRIKDDEEVPPIKRALAKNVNFSMAFGATAFTLMNRYEVKTEREANALIDGFYAAYPKVKPWQERTLRECRATYRRKEGGQAYVAPFVRTLSGRKRRLPEIFWDVKGIRRAAERQAINTRIQGTAADLVKMAMIEVHRTLEPDMKLILSVHDELVVLVPEAKADRCLEIVKGGMERINPLKVKLVAEAHIVDNWAEAK